MRILVTGGTGMVGKHLKKILPEAIYIGSKECDLTDTKLVRLNNTAKPEDLFPDDYVYDSSQSKTMVKHFKEMVGDIYLFPTEDDKGWEEYIYTVYPKGGEPCDISIWSVFEERCIFVGTALELIEKYTPQES